jgi:Na+-driven multidrug efflux pump
MDQNNTSRPGRRDLTSGPIPSTLLLFALPVLGSNVLQSLNGSINSVWVGRFLGESALAIPARPSCSWLWPWCSTSSSIRC